MLVELGLDWQEVHILLLLWLLVVVDRLLVLTGRSVWCEDCGCIHLLWLWVVDVLRASRVWSVCWVLVLHHVFRGRCEDSHGKSMRLLVGDILWVPVHLSVVMGWLWGVIEEWLRLRSVLHCECG